MSQEDNKEFSTPYRTAEEKEVSETAAKGVEESHYEKEEEPAGEEQDDLEAKLTELESDIKETEERLKLVKQKKG